MNTIHDVALWIHIASGFTALTLFWTAVLMPKGGPIHRKAGGVYVAAMLVVVATAVVMAVLLAIHPQRVRDFTGVPPDDVASLVARLRGVSAFFGALALLTVTAGWNGLRALWARRRPRAWYRPTALVLYLLNVAVFAPLIWLGLRDGEPLLLIFAAFCLLTGAGGLWSLWRTKEGPRDWLLRHLANMIATGIAAHTAFFAVGAVRWFPNLYSYSPALYVIPWIMPALLGTIATVLLKRHYRNIDSFNLGGASHGHNRTIPN